MRLFRVFTNFCLFCLIRSDKPLLNVEQSEGSRVETIDTDGAHRANFTWIRTSKTVSWLQAAQECQALGGSLPRANEMRYFYKTLRSDNAPLPNHSGNETVFGVKFYLADVLEATMDYPNTESGERMCLVVEKRPNSHVSLAEVNAIHSCVTPVNLLVCRFAIDRTGARSGSLDLHDTGSWREPTPCDPYSNELSQIGPQPAWIIELKKRAEFQDHHVCFKPAVFYTVSVLCGLITILTMLITLALAIRHHRLLHQLKRAPYRGDYLLNAPSTAGSEMGTGQNGGVGKADELDAGGSMDILADSAFFRAPGSGPNESYKQAIIQDGYQKLSNGPGSSGRSRMRSSRSMGSWSTSTRGLNASIRRPQGRGAAYSDGLN